MSTYRATEARNARKLVELQTASYDGSWDVYGRYQAGGRPLRLALRDVRESYHSADIRIIPVVKG